jgi:hypothetical protein
MTDSRADRALDSLFSLEFGPGSESAAFHEIIDLVNGILADSPISIAVLIDRLQQCRSDTRILPAYSRDVVDHLLDAVITLLLNKDTAIPLLVQKLDDYEGRYFAATMLGWFGSDAVGAIPALIGLASGPSGGAGAAQQAIVRIGGGESAVLSALEASLTYDDAGDFGQLNELFMQAGYTTIQKYLDIVHKAAIALNPELRGEAVYAIAKLSTADKQRLASEIQQLKRDPIDSVRTAAMTEL